MSGQAPCVAGQPITRQATKMFTSSHDYPHRVTNLHPLTGTCHCVAIPTVARLLTPIPVPSKFKVRFILEYHGTLCE